MSAPVRRAPGSEAASTAGFTAPTPPRPADRRRLPEPPALRQDPLTAPRACVNCATPVGASVTTPRCWGCGRALCTECYWRHGLVPSAHRCTSCLVAGGHGSTYVSGGRMTEPRTGFTPSASANRD
ncbi:MAG TPA: hypothetical protein VMF04_07400 [Thermoplasmata archaeon]|nr:hypothetical protein [Thermoplasmata archaeon]